MSSQPRRVRVAATMQYFAHELYHKRERKTALWWRPQLAGAGIRK